MRSTTRELTREERLIFDQLVDAADIDMYHIGPLEAGGLDLSLVSNIDQSILWWVRAPTWTAIQGVLRRNPPMVTYTDENAFLVDLVTIKLSL